MIERNHLPDAVHGVSQGSIWLTVGQGALLTIYDLRYLLMLTAVLIIADCWWAYRENKSHEEAGEKVKEWRPSQAIRRSAIKFCDYISFMIVGDLIGTAIVDTFTGHHIAIYCSIGAVCVLAIAEVLSVFGHIMWCKWKYQLRLREVPMALWYIVRGMGVEFLKMKSPEAGEALEKSLNKMDKKGNSNESKSKH